MSALLRTCEGLVRSLDLLAATYPQPGGRPVHVAVSVDGVTFSVDTDEESVSFLACRAAESAARGQVTVNLDHLSAAQAKADELVAGIAEAPEPGRHLLVAITDPVTRQRLATCFVNYATAGTRLRLVTS